VVSTGVNIGTDLIEVRRFRNKSLDDDNASFYNSIFTESELAYCMKYSDPYPHIAGIFAAKESIMKCLRRPLRMIDIEITHNKYGKPIAVVNCGKKTIRVRISISHTRSLAIAMAITNF
jgi:holo-[acyl-carrier protein] synthase